MQFKRIAVDTSKATFTVHGVDAEDRPILKQNLSRAQFEVFCRKLAPTELVLEACGGSHHWGRLLLPVSALGRGALADGLRRLRCQVCGKSPSDIWISCKGESWRRTTVKLWGEGAYG